jgi:hypothetical protein
MRGTVEGVTALPQSLEARVAALEEAAATLRLRQEDVSGILCRMVDEPFSHPLSDDPRNALTAIGRHGLRQLRWTVLSANTAWALVIGAFSGFATAPLAWWLATHPGVGH